MQGRVHPGGRAACQQVMEEGWLKLDEPPGGASEARRNEPAPAAVFIFATATAAKMDLRDVRAITASSRVEPVHVENLQSQIGVARHRSRRMVIGHERFAAGKRDGRVPAEYPSRRSISLRFVQVWPSSLEIAAGRRRFGTGPTLAPAARTCQGEAQIAFRAAQKGAGGKPLGTVQSHCDSFAA